MNADPKATIPGSYGFGKTPDGQEVMMHRTADGKWVITEERLRSETDAFMSRFDDTETIPTPACTRDSGQLQIKPDALVKRYSQTRNNVDAYLGEVLRGGPETLMARDPLCMEAVKAVRDRPQELRHVLGLIRVLNDARWNLVRDTFLNA